MKKVLTIIITGTLAIASCASLVGCNGNSKDDNKTTTAATTAAPTTKAAETKVTTAAAATETAAAENNNNDSESDNNSGSDNAPAIAALSATEQAALDYTGISASNATVESNGYTDTDEGPYYMFTITDNGTGETRNIYVNGSTNQAMDILDFWNRFPQFAPGGGENLRDPQEDVASDGIGNGYHGFADDAPEGVPADYAE